MLIVNNKALKITNKWLNPVAGSGPTPPGPTPPGPSFDEVTIGTQTWMAKSLAIDDGEGGIIIKDNVTANGVNFGTQYYYTYDAAKRIADSISGWHLPTNEEFNTLISTIGSNPGTKLKSTYGWNEDNNGTDDYDFNGIPVGYYDITNNNLVNAGGNNEYWTATQSIYASNLMVTRALNVFSNIYENQMSKSSYGLSVRLVKDAT